MQEQFTLFYAVQPNITEDQIMDRLYECGCDDCLIGLGAVGKVTVVGTSSAQATSTAIETIASNISRCFPEMTLENIVVERVD